MDTAMRAKLIVSNVKEHHYGPEGAKSGEELFFNAVGKSTAYEADGLDEDNTFAKYTPSAELHLTVMNPALFDKFKVGQKFYVDFTPAS